MTDLDLEQPNTRWGWCPTCAQPANIWNDTRREWLCGYCNWSGQFPVQKDLRLAYQPPHFKEN